MKTTLFGFFIALAIFLTLETGVAASAGTKIVTRIDNVTAVMKGGALIVQAEGMAVTPERFGVSAQLLKRGQKLNPDGLLEYELVFNPPQNYSGDKLKQVKATFKDSSIPAGTKGVRIYAEFNEMNSMLPVSKQAPVVTKKETFLKNEEPVVAKKEKPVTKKEELAPKKAEQGKTSQWWNPFHHKPATVQVSATPPATKKQGSASKKKELVAKKEEPVIAKKEKPALKREELAPKKKETALKKEEKSPWWNPFYHKTATAQVSVPPTATKKEAPVLKKNEPAAKKEEFALKKEETAPKKEEKKSRGWNLNPFRRKSVASQTNATPPEPKKQELELKKKEPAVRTEESAVIRKENPISKKEEAALLKKEEEEARKKEEKKSRGWNLNPFHRKSAASQTNATPPEPKKEESTSKKKEPVVTKEKPTLKKEQAAPSKKEETEKKKKNHWWNPFHRKPDTDTSDESPR